VGNGVGDKPNVFLLTVGNMLSFKEVMQFAMGLHIGINAVLSVTKDAS
jgi:hypothetical protein